MSDFPFELIGFDLAAAVNHVLAGLDRPPLSVAQVRRNIGGGGRRMLALSLADAGVDEPAALEARYAALLAYYGDHIADATRPYPNVIATLDALTASGARLAVVTNKVERLAVRLLEALGLADKFAAIIGGDSVAKGKPAPDPLFEVMDRCGTRRAAFVGDSEFDVIAAHAAGLPCVAVSFGFPGKPVEELGADAVIDDFGILPDVLRRLGGQTGR